MEEKIINQEKEEEEKEKEKEYLIPLYMFKKSEIYSIFKLTAIDILQRKIPFPTILIKKMGRYGKLQKWVVIKESDLIKHDVDIDKFNYLLENLFEYSIEEANDESFSDFFSFVPIYSIIKRILDNYKKNYFINKKDLVDLLIQDVNQNYKGLTILLRTFLKEIKSKKNEKKDREKNFFEALNIEKKTQEKICNLLDISMDNMIFQKDFLNKYRRRISKVSNIEVILLNIILLIGLNSFVNSLKTKNNPIYEKIYPMINDTNDNEIK